MGRYLDLQLQIGFVTFHRGSILLVFAFPASGLLKASKQMSVQPAKLRLSDLERKERKSRNQVSMEAGKMTCADPLAFSNG